MGNRVVGVVHVEDFNMNYTGISWCVVKVVEVAEVKNPANKKISSQQRKNVLNCSLTSKERKCVNNESSKSKNGG